MQENTTVESFKTVIDTLQQSSGDDSSWILHHIMDGRELDFEPFFTIHIPQFPLIFGIDITPTKHIVFMWLVALLVLILFTIIARQYNKSLIPNRLANLFEVLILFVRDDIAKSTIGKGYEKFVPYLLTLFFFLLFGNFLGLLPWSATFTSNIGMTATLAICSFFITQFSGIRSNGFIGYFKGLMPPGIPILLSPLMVLVELLGLFTKPFALAIRLFANMIAGHTVILGMIGLIFFMGTILVAPVSIIFVLFIYLLEILVALIQAYIFTILTSLFIGMAVHQEH
ncbi:MAG: F0F1 ATP synthase subunit A [Ignavibacteriaceae bacterium]|jgi:F-type H+-transporting ATPase subunit a